MIKRFTVATLFVCSLASAQSSITIGEGTGSGAFAPIATWYESSAIKSIYTKTEIGLAGTITKLAFQKATGNSTTEPAVKIYLKNTATSAVSAAYAIGNDGFSGYTLVYDGTLPNNFTNAWAEVTLQNPYVYNTSQNLSLLVTGTCIESGRPQYRYTTTQGNKLSSQYNDGSIGCGGNNPWTATSSMSPVWERPNLKITFGTLSAENFTANDAIVYTTEQGINIMTVNSAITSIQAFDLQGRLLTSHKNINTKEFTLTTLPKANSMIVLKIMDADNRVTTKKALY